MKKKKKYGILSKNVTTRYMNGNEKDPFFNVIGEDDEQDMIISCPEVNKLTDYQASPAREGDENISEIRDIMLLVIKGKATQEELFRLIRYYKINDIPVSIEIKKLYKRAIGKMKTFPSNTEKEYYNRIKKVFPNAQCNKIVDGYELDIFIPGEDLGDRNINLVIEIDGRQHGAGNKIKKDRKRDYYLKKVYGCDTLRVSADEKYIGKIIKYLQNVVKAGVLKALENGTKSSS